MSLARSSRDELGRRVVVLLLLAMVLLVPNLFWPNHQELSGTKAILIQTTAVALLLLMVSGARWTREGIGQFFRTGPNLAVLLFLGWSLLTYLDSPYRAYGLQQLFQLAAGAAVYFAVVYRLPERRNLQTVVGGLVGAVILSVVIGALLYRGQADGKIAAAFGNSQLFAGFLVLAVPLVLVASQAEDHPFRRAAAQFALILAVAALLLTLNRSAWIGTAAGLTLLGALVLRSHGGGRDLMRQKHQILLPGLLIVGAVGAFFLLTATGGSVFARLLTLGSAGADATFRWRTDMWSAATQMFASSPIFGWGIGSFPYWAGFLEAPALPTAAAMNLAPSLGEMAHNQYLQVLAETGFVGLGLYLAVLAGFFIRCGRALRHRTSQTRRWLLMGSMASITAMCVDAIGNPAWQFADVSLFFWLVLGIGIAASRPRAERAGAPGALQGSGSDAATVTDPGRRTRSTRALRVGWAMAQVAVLAGVVSVATRAYAVDRAADQPGFAAPVPNYTRIRDCRITPSARTLRVPRPPVGGGVARSCTQFRFIVHFVPQGPLDVTEQPAVLWESLSPCVVSMGGGLFCVESSVPDTCLGEDVTIRATINPGNPNPDSVCSDTATIHLSRVRGTPGGGGGGAGGGDDGGSTGILIGAIAGAGLLFFLLGRRKEKKGGGDDENGEEGRESPSVSLPAHERVTAIRTDPPKLTLKPGDQETPQQIKVLVQLDGKSAWYDVTQHPDTELSVATQGVKRIAEGENADRYQISRAEARRGPVRIVAAFRGQQAESELAFRTP